MLHLIHLPHPEWMYDNVLILDVIQRFFSENKNTVKVLLCDSTINICTANPTAEILICKWCKYYRNKLINKLSKKIDVLYYRDFYFPENEKNVNSLNFEYNSISMIKKIFYRNVNIGYAALSSYISITRNIDPLINEDFKSYFNLYLKAECVLIEILNNIYKHIKPDLVSLYNGRFFETRPVFEFSKYLGYPVRCYENIRGEKLTERRIFYYENSLPQNIEYCYEHLFKNMWNNADLTEDEKIRIGSSFFRNRRNSIPAGDKVYTNNQKLGLLPNGFNKSKRNIAFFMSSEDELCSINEEYDNNIFDSQYCGLVIILKYFKNDNNFHFYIRIHPNLKNVYYKYHTLLLNLNFIYPNVTIIKADEEISSYTLLDNVEKVLVFGSTLGVEACYWKKPVILLHSAIYEKLNICYKPKTIDEALFLINLDNLPLKDNKDSIKFGFSYMYNPGEKYFYFDFNIKYIKILNKKILLLNYKPVKYSLFFLSILHKIINILNKMNLYTRIKVPIDER
jgi:hypothetical protein